MIIEYCRFGNLRNYMINHRKNFVNELSKRLAIGEDFENSHQHGIIISTNDLISWSFQIARGMDFLSRKKVHYLKYRVLELTRI